MQTILKNMRAGQIAEPLFGSDQHEMYLEMMDQQLSLEMSRGSGLGFADMLVRQLGGEANAAPAAIERAAVPGQRASTPAARESALPADWSTPGRFVADIWPHAKRVAEHLGVAADGLLAQAALETGWGRQVMQRADGNSSHNLFGIKAGSDWFGGSVVKKTVEFRDGIAEEVRARFRAYPDVAAAFDDYARFITDSSRYAGVRGTGGDTERFSEALQEAGYATDPLYAKKIRRILGSDTFREAISPLKSFLKTPDVLPITSGSTQDAVP